jgi:hypothetical protein
MGKAELGASPCGPSALATLEDEERRARNERIDQHLANAREQMAILDEIIGEWRAKGILPPEEPRRRV